MKFVPLVGIEPAHTREQCYPILYRRRYKTPASVFITPASVCLFVYVVHGCGECHYSHNHDEYCDRGFNNCMYHILFIFLVRPLVVAVVALAATETTHAAPPAEHKGEHLPSAAWARAILAGFLSQVRVSFCGTNFYFIFNDIFFFIVLSRIVSHQLHSYYYSSSYSYEYGYTCHYTHKFTTRTAWIWFFPYMFFLKKILLPVKPIAQLPLTCA